MPPAIAVEGQRADTLLAIAIAWPSVIRLVLLDSLDVLEPVPPCDEIAAGPDHHQRPR